MLTFAYLSLEITYFQPKLLILIFSSHCYFFSFINHFPDIPTCVPVSSSMQLVNYILTTLNLLASFGSIFKVESQNLLCK